MRTAKNTLLLHSLLLLLLVLGSYSHTLNFSWHLDDTPNILANQPLHLTDLSVQSITNTFFANPTTPGQLFRPLPNLTFAFNWYFGGNTVIGYHFINIVIHLFTTLALYAACFQLLHSPKVRNLGRESAFRDVALLTAALWAISPLQIQAVTYIVQRMAQLAALFYISGIYCYFKVRYAHNIQTKLAFSLFTFLCFFCALASKENAVTFPIALLLIEITFFDGRKKFHRLLANYKYVNIPTLVVSFCTFFLLFNDFFFKLLQSYSHRNFTLVERLLTEPRVLVFHFGQLLAPNLSSFSIEHNIILSTTLFSPWTTLPAIILCCCLIGISLVLLDKSPILSFGILFFFLGHFIESTFLPLELIHEHRNYLPSLFFFLPFSFYLVLFSQIICQRSRAACGLILLVMVGTITSTTMTTISRNRVWKTEETLWQDAMIKAPDSARPHLNLAKVYFEQNRLSESAQFCKQAFQKDLPTAGEAQGLALTGQGAILLKYQQYNTASTLFEKALLYKPNLFIARHSLVLSLIHEKKFNNALKQINIILDENYFAPFLILKGDILLNSYKTEQAIITYGEALRQDSLNFRALLGLGRAMSMSGFYRQADFFLRVAEKSSLAAGMYRVKNDIIAGNEVLAKEHLSQLITRYPVMEILQRADDIDNSLTYLPFHPPLKQFALKHIPRLTN